MLGVRRVTFGREGARQLWERGGRSNSHIAGCSSGVVSRRPQRRKLVRESFQLFLSRFFFSYISICK